MIPIYLSCIFLVLCSYKNWKFFKGSWLRKITSCIFLFSLLEIGFLLSTILPLPITKVKKISSLTEQEMQQKQPSQEDSLTSPKNIALCHRCYYTKIK